MWNSPTESNPLGGEISLELPDLRAVTVLGGGAFATILKQGRGADQHADHPQIWPEARSRSGEGFLR